MARMATMQVTEQTISMIIGDVPKYKRGTAIDRMLTGLFLIRATSSPVPGTEHALFFSFATFRVAQKFMNDPTTET
jgi:hypothetical protein